MRDKEEWAGTATELLAAMRETETIPTVITNGSMNTAPHFLNENHIVYQYSRKKHGRQISLAKRAGICMVTVVTAILGYPCYCH